MLSSVRKWFDEMERNGKLKNLLEKSAGKSRFEINDQVFPLNQSLGTGYMYNGQKILPIDPKTLTSVDVRLRGDAQGGFVIETIFIQAK